MRESVNKFMREISTMSDMDELNRSCAEFMGGIPPSNGLEVAAALAHANPFYLPNVGEKNAADLKLSLVQFSEWAMRAKITCRYSKQLNILVACAPKSASTFIQGALRQATGLPAASLSSVALSPLASSRLGMNLREQETDELALIRNGMNGLGYVAQHHVRCTPYLCAQMQLYNIRPLVTYRNIFDTLVSLDDMFISWRSNIQDPDMNYFDDGLPGNYSSLDRDDRIEILINHHVSWLIQFYVSWKKCEAMGSVSPVWISYGRDFQGDKTVLAQRIVEHIGHEGMSVELLAEALEDSDAAKSARLNVGIVGRGADLAPRLRDKVLSICRRYEAEADLSPLIEYAVN